MKDSDKPKLIIAVVILVIAAGLLAWNFGLFGGGTAVTPTPDTPPARTGGPQQAPGK